MEPCAARQTIWCGANSPWPALRENLAHRRQFADTCLVPSLSLCPGCARHIRADESVCPFCAQRPRLTVHREPASRLWACSLPTICLVGTIASGCTQRPVSECAGSGCLNSVSGPVTAPATTEPQSTTSPASEPAPATSEQEERKWHPVYGAPRPPHPKPKQACRCDPGEPLCDCY